MYAGLNRAGEGLDPSQFRAAVDEAYGAFAHNAAVYSEDTPLALNAARGAVNVAAGYAKAAMGGLGR